MIQTSYFARYKQDNGISIARTPPVWYGGEKFPDLYPPAKLLYERRQGIRTDAQFTEIYCRLVLMKYDANELVRKLDGKVLLCWEKSGEFCHRRIVASWIERKTGIVVPEWMPEEKEENGRLFV